MLAALLPCSFTFFSTCVVKMLRMPVPVCSADYLN